MFSSEVSENVWTTNGSVTKGTNTLGRISGHRLKIFTVHFWSQDILFTRMELHVEFGVNNFNMHHHDLHLSKKSIKPLGHIVTINVKY